MTEHGAEIWLAGDDMVPPDDTGDIGDIGDSVVPGTVPGGGDM